MRLVEKKCPNCGANLEFDEDDKSCRCTYCKRSFEIERDLNDIDKFNLIYEKIHKPFKMVMIVPFIFAGVVFLMIFLSIFFSMRRVHTNNSNNKPSHEIIDIEDKEEEKLLTDVSELSNSDFDMIDNHATVEINHSGEGVNDASHSYSIDGKITREKLYIAYKKGSNFVIPIYKATYRDFFHQEDRSTVYVPIVFENIEKDIVFSIGNPKLSAPVYYLSSDQSSFTYGYASLEEAYNEVIKPYEEEYTITEK